ncbi:DNA polymerase [Microbacterium sp. HM58-2]|nr:DNA polymerase [Microbacterium sp. HM58-2]
MREARGFTPRAYGVVGTAVLGAEGGVRRRHDAGGMTPTARAGGTAQRARRRRQDAGGTTQAVVHAALAAYADGCTLCDPSSCGSRERRA